MRLAILPAAQRRPLWRPPDWLDALVSVGLVSPQPEVRRRQKFVNVTAFAAAADSLFHVFYDAVQGIPGLAPVHVNNLVLSVLFLSVPLTHRLGEIFAAICLCLVVLASVAFVLWAVGLEIGAHVYLTVFPVTYIFFGPRHWRWFAALLAVDLGLLLAALALAPTVGTLAPGTAAWRHGVAGQVLIGALTVNTVLICYAVTALRRTEEALETAHAQAETLLTTLLPARIASLLKADPARTLAERFDRASIMFVDIVGFTRAIRDLPPEQVVSYLDRLYTRFDRLAAEHGVEKIKTMGDGYMVAGGLAGDAGDGARAIARLALAIVAIVREQPPLGGTALAVRVGIHSGPAIAGVIGERRFSYDLWGDAVNVAARLEAAAPPGAILVSQPFADLVSGAFALTPQAGAAIRDAGDLRTAILVAERAGNEGGAGP